MRVIDNTRRQRQLSCFDSGATVRLLKAVSSIQPKHPLLLLNLQKYCLYAGDSDNSKRVNTFCKVPVVNLATGTLHLLDDSREAVSVEAAIHVE